MEEEKKIEGRSAQCSVSPVGESMFVIVMIYSSTSVFYNKTQHDERTACSFVVLGVVVKMVLLLLVETTIDDSSIATDPSDRIRGHRGLIDEWFTIRTIFPGIR